jgi:hypothetical protein
VPVTAVAPAIAGAITDLDEITPAVATHLRAIDRTRIVALAELAFALAVPANIAAVRQALAKIFVRATHAVAAEAAIGRTALL